MTKIKRKGKIHKDYHCLDLLLNDKYYEQFNPLIVRLKKPITFSEYQYGKTLIPEYTLEKFVVHTKTFKKFLKFHQQDLTIENTNSRERPNIKIEDLEYDFNNNPKEEVFDILKDKGIPFHIGLYAVKDYGFYNSINYYDQSLLNVANGMLFFEQDEAKSLSPEEYLEVFNPQRTNNPTFAVLFKNDETIFHVKTKLKEYFKYFFEQKTLDVAKDYLSFNRNDETDEEMFSKKWIDYQSLYNSTHFLNLLENPIISSAFTEKERTNLAVKLIKKNHENRSNIYFDSITISFFLKKNISELKEIFKELNDTQDSNPQMKIGSELKEIILSLKKTNKTEIKDVETNKKFIKYIPWQEITLSRFKDIASTIDTPYYFYDDMELKYSRLKDVYHPNKSPVLFGMMIFLDGAYKTIMSLTHNEDFFEDSIQEFNSTNQLTNPTSNIYLTNKGLFVELMKPGNNSKINIPDLMDFVVDSINPENLQDSSKFQAQLKQKILIQKLNISAQTEDKSNDFKI